MAEYTNSMIQWFENLSPHSLEKMGDYYEQNVFFKDPFNELNGLEDTKKVFQHMFEQTKDPRFVFIDQIHSEHQSFLTWDFHFCVGKRKILIHGSSHLKWSDQGKVAYHRDYWDVGEEVIEKIPLLSAVYRYATKGLRL